MIVAQGREAVAEVVFNSADNRMRTNMPHNFALGRTRELARGRLSTQGTVQERWSG
ncbi:hypothetical protein [Hydrogenophaga aromaticivorans]|uniref:hypothetical protein n=1 Tax=Hydrogenophaga aromaticivorans TaxID=2610898 RepID=UPI0015A45078|nr:hypothetical protein [Hydrogenophaga aromaticivorans]